MTDLCCSSDCSL